MKKKLLFISIFQIVLSCNRITTNEYKVRNIQELEYAIQNIIPGDEIILSNGIWKDVEIKFYGIGKKNMPIILRAETPGKVFIQGKSSLHLDGENLIVDGLYFKNGYSPNNSVISYRINKDSIAFNRSVKNCVIEKFTKPNRLTNDHWIDLYGQYNEIRNCYVSGKSNDGETLRVYHTGNQNTSNHHQIVNNYFGPRPRKGGPRAETIRIGDSKTSMSSGFVNVSNNYFEACNGEVEIISDKTNFNNFSNNIFYKCEGSLVLRHGSFSKVNGNIFIRGNESNYYRGGYDESTIGGSLSISDSFFTNCGTKEKSGILLKTQGIINVAIDSNTFKNNPIKHIAILWGEKNNHHLNNSIINSGKITVAQQQKQEILY